MSVSELEEKIGQLLSDPNEMEKLAQMASQLMGGMMPGAPEKESSPAREPSGGDPAFADTLTRLMGMLQGSRDRPSLAEALGPYLAEPRRRRLEKALRVAQMAKLAGSAFADMGGGGGDGGD